jgi:hypothetical protein
MTTSTVPVGGTTFTVRVWPEATSPESIEWRGRVQHLPSGATRYFRDWSTLIAFLQVPESSSPMPGGEA